jgi:hypothetical protein
MHLFGRIRFDFIERHKANFFNYLPVKTHFGIKPLPNRSSYYANLKKKLQRVQGRLSEFVDEQHIAYLNCQATFFVKFTNKPFAGGFAKLKTATGWAPKRVGQINAPVPNHQQSVAFAVKPTYPEPEPVAI